MFRSMRIAGSQLPGPRAEYKYEQQEENPRDFQEDDAAHPPEWTKKTAEPAGHAARCAACPAI